MCSVCVQTASPRCADGALLCILPPPPQIAPLVVAGERPLVPDRESCPGFRAYKRYVRLMRDCWSQARGARGSAGQGRGKVGGVKGCANAC